MKFLNNNYPNVKLKYFFLCRGIKPYGCRFCEARFSRTHNRKDHERIHTGEKPYSCDFCDMKFTASQNRDAHER